MQIEEKEFILTQNKGNIMFTVELPKVVNAGKDNERIEFDIIANGVPFESAIKMIVGYKMSQLDKFTLKDYVLKYQSITNEVIELIKSKLK